MADNDQAPGCAVVAPAAGVRPDRGLAASHGRRRIRATAAGARSRRNAGAACAAADAESWLSQISDHAVQGNRAASGTERTSRATARGGAAYHNRNVGIFTVRDGKIAAVREYTDTQHAAHVLFGQP